MIVEAVKVGFFGGQLIPVGKRFDIGSKDDLGDWMKIVEAPKKKRAKKAKLVAVKKVDEEGVE